MPLKKDIGLVGLLFASISGIIGSGWLFAPFYAAQVAGPAAILSWLIGFFLILLLAVCFAEVATMFPVAGGVVQFIKFSHGKAASFLVSWLNWLSFVMVPAIEVQATLQYSAHFFPEVIKHSRGGFPLTGLGFGLAALLLAFFMLINTIGIKYVVKLNNISVWWKLIIPVVAIITLVAHHFDVHNFVNHGGFIPLGVSGVFSAVTTGGIIFSFAGFRQAVELAEETDNPKRNVPIALIGSLAVALLVYLMLQLGFIGTLKSIDFQHGWQHLSLLGDAGPFVDIASVLGIVWLVALLYLDAIVSPSSTSLIFTAATARIIYAMGKAGIVPNVMAKTNRFGAPILAIVVDYIVALLFFFPFPGWQQMAQYLAGVAVLAYVVGPISLVALRHQQPLRERSFKLPLPRIISCLAILAGSFIILWSGWKTVEILAVTCAIGFIIFLGYFIFQRYKQTEASKSFYTEIRGCLWFLLLILVLVCVSYFGPFGGNASISVGWDLLVTAILVVFIYMLAIKLRLPSEVTQAYINEYDL